MNKTLWELAQEMRGLVGHLSGDNPLTGIVRDTAISCAEKTEQSARETANFLLRHKNSNVVNVDLFLRDLGVPEEK